MERDMVNWRETISVAPSTRWSELARERFAERAQLKLATGKKIFRFLYSSRNQTPSKRFLNGMTK